MTHSELPGELHGLERRISQRRFVAPTSARDKILAVVKSELMKRRTAPVNREHVWGFAAAIAAALLVGLNLARIAASVSDVPGSREGELPSAAVTQAIAELEPAVGSDESRRVVILAEARAARRNASPRGSSAARLENL